jgi:hypothetical protein
MFIVAGDLGYRYTKGINRYGDRILFPSVVGPGFKKEHSRYLGDTASVGFNADNLYLKISDGEGFKEYFVGNLAQAELKNPVYPFAENKIYQTETRVLIAALVMMATIIMGPTQTEPLCFATGLPFKYFGPQHREFEAFLKKLDFFVTYESGEIRLSRRVRFDEIILFPQGVGAIWHARERHPGLLQDEGALIGLVDIGGKTTEIVLFSVTERGLELRENLSDTFNLGTSTVEDEIYNAYHKKTGSVLSDADLSAMVRRGYIYHNGEKMEFHREIAIARKMLADNIINAMNRRWGDQVKQVKNIVFVGGGAADLSYNIKQLPNAIIALDPQFANVSGYYKVARAKMARLGMFTAKRQ